MPTNPLLENNEQDDKDKAAQGAQLASGDSADITGTGSTQGAGGVTPESQRSSGSFTNLNQYVQANKDQGTGLGAKIEQNVQKDANAGLSSLSQAQQQFGDKLKAATVNPADYSVEKVYGQVQGAVNNPGGSSSDYDDLAKGFADVRNKASALKAGTDVGPKDISSLDSFQTAKNQLGNAEQKAKLTQTESGRETLLRGGTIQADPNDPNAKTKITGGFQRPDYSKGQSSLDQLLTQNVPDNKKRFEDLHQKLLGQYGLASQENQAIQNSAAQRSQAIEGTTQAANNLQNVLYGSADNSAAPQGVKYGLLSEQEKALQNAPATLNAQQAANIKAAKDKVKTQLNAGTLGLNVDDFINSIVNPQNALNSATLTNSIKPEDLAKLNVLNKLAGRQQNQLGESIYTPVDSSAVFNPNVAIDKTKAAQLIQDRRNTFSNDVKQKSAVNEIHPQQIYDLFNRSNNAFANKNNNKADADKLSSIMNAKLDDITNYQKGYGINSVPLRASEGDIQSLIYNKYAPAGSSQRQALQNPNTQTAQEYFNYLHSLAGAEATYNLLAKINQDPGTLLGGATAQNLLQNVK